MTQPDKHEWEDIVPSGTGAGTGARTEAKKGTANASPFAVVNPVDGYAFTDNPESPELRYQREPQAEMPVRTQRERPQRIRDQALVPGVWQPGGPVSTGEPALRMPRPNLAIAILSGLIPLGVLAGGLYLVMRLFGIW